MFWATVFERYISRRRGLSNAWLLCSRVGQELDVLMLRAICWHALSKLAVRSALRGADYALMSSVREDVIKLPDYHCKM